MRLEYKEYFRKVVQIKLDRKLTIVLSAIWIISLVVGIAERKQWISNCAIAGIPIVLAINTATPIPYLYSILASVIIKLFVITYYTFGSLKPPPFRLTLRITYSSMPVSVLDSVSKQ